MTPNLQPKSFKWPEILLTSSDKNAKKIYDKDWSDTPMGPIESWPIGLITTLTTSLGSQFPAFILWGTEFISFFNEGYGTVLGEKQAWALGKPLKEIWPEAWDSLYGMLKGVIATGTGSWAEDQIYYLHRNGYPEETYFTFSFARIIDEKGGFGGSLCSAIETTQKVIGERRLKTLREIASRTAGKALMEVVYSECLKVLNEHPQDIPFALLTRVATDGTAAGDCESFGIATSALDLTPFFSGSHPLFKRVFETGIGEFVDSVPTEWVLLPSKIGQEPAKSIFVLPIKLSSNAPVCALLTVGLSAHLPFNAYYRDFLDLLSGQISAAAANAKAQGEAKARAEELVRVDQAKTAFFSNVSHEFRTPLTLILGPMEDALKQTRGQKVILGRETFESVYRNSLRLLKLVNSLLDFSRVEAGRAEASFEPVDLHSYTQELASQFSTVMQKGGLKLLVDTAPIQESIYIDREMWEKIVLNLLSNAFKFTLAGTVHISLKEQASGVELLVTDTGTGIPAHELPKIFQRFHRVEGAKSRTFEGSGIGLALVQELVKLHGGAVAVESTYGKGSTFRVTIPKGHSHLPAHQLKGQRVTQSTRLKAEAYIEEASRWLPDEATARDQDTPVTSHKYTVLVVDDNSDMRSYLTQILGSSYSVSTATNGREALRLIEARLPDLMVSDIMMPEMNGLELLSELRLRERTQHLPIILLSARAGDEATVEGLEAGADDYLVKPFSSKELLARVKTQLSMVELRTNLNVERRALEARDEFLSIASHELNTPLTPLKIQLETLTRVMKKGNLASLPQERLERMVSVFEQQVDKISKLISDLLDVSRISQGTLDLKRSKITLASVVHGAVEQYMPQLSLAKCPVTFDLDENIVGNWDPSRLEQVVTNLVMNAAKYAPERPIKISVYANNQKALLTVEDYGPGISEENSAKVFNRFERIGASTNLGGLGLGLYICKQVVESHGGRIQMESTLGKGTKITVELPVE